MKLNSCYFITTRCFVFEVAFVLRAEGPVYPLPVSKAPDNENFAGVRPEGSTYNTDVSPPSGLNILGGLKPGLVSPGIG